MKGILSPSNGVSLFFWLWSFKCEGTKKPLQSVLWVTSVFDLQTSNVPFLFERCFFSMFVSFSFRVGLCLCWVPGAFSASDLMCIRIVCLLQEFTTHLLDLFSVLQFYQFFFSYIFSLYDPSSSSILLIQFEYFHSEFYYFQWWAGAVLPLSVVSFFSLFFSFYFLLSLFLSNIRLHLFHNNASFVISLNINSSHSQK